MSYQRCVWLAGILVLGLGMVACSSSTAHSSTVHTGPTPNISATQTIQAELYGPVTVQVKIIKQTGSLAAKNINLIVQVTVTNHTTKAISLFGTCPLPSIAWSIVSQTAPAQPIKFYGYDSCPLGTGYDSPNIVSNGSVTQQYQFYLFGYNTDWQPGNYTLSATVPGWHQGTIDQISTPDTSLLSGVALGQTTVALA